MTETELKLMAAAAIIGLNSRSKGGYSTPAAMGTPIALYTKAKKRFCLMLRMAASWYPHHLSGTACVRLHTKYDDVCA